MASKLDLENARRAYEHAWTESQRYFEQALDAFKKAEQFGSPTTSGLFKQISDNALLASENWRKAAELANEVIAEIETGVPRKRN